MIRAEAPGFKSKSQLVSFKSDRVSVALNLDPEGRAKPGLVDAVLADIRALAAGVRGARGT